MPMETDISAEHQRRKSLAEGEKYCYNMIPESEGRALVYMYASTRPRDS